MFTVPASKKGSLFSLCLCARLLRFDDRVGSSGVASWATDFFKTVRSLAELYNGACGPLSSSYKCFYPFPGEEVWIGYHLILQNFYS